jgi:hypothetical protein
MIACDDHFLNDESILKTMLRVFEKRTARILRLKSISWVVSFLSFRRKARDVWMCECVCVCLCVWEEMQMRSVVFEKSFSFVQFKDFYLLRSILELIIRSLVNIKRKERSLLRWQKFKYSFTQFYLNLNYYSFHFLKLFEIYLLCLVVLFRQNDRF